MRDAWAIVGIALLMLILLEVVCGWWRGRGSGARSYPMERMVQDGYGGADWVLDVHAEADEAAHKATWHPYVQWRLSPYEGKYVNVGEEGLRRTWSPPRRERPAGEKPKRIFVFGGSTIWNMGARDEHTITSLLAKSLTQEHGLDVEVTSYAQLGYVATQEMITLALELRKGNVPDLVVFYDGINDILAAGQAGRAGVPQNEHRRVLEFNLSRRERLHKAALKSWLRNLSTVRVLGDPLGKNQPRKSAWMAGEPSDDLARDVIDCYLGTVRVVEALGRAYGFKTLFFWQPVGWHKNPLSDFEKKVFKWEEKRREWILQVYGEAARRLAEVPSVHDIQTLFADDERTLYFDMMHLTETGLRAVEARLRVEVLRVLKD